jgi:type I restriction enzyme S subunit
MELNEVCDLIIDCEHKTAPIQETGYPSIRTPNIGQGRFILEGVNRVSEETYQLWTRRAVPQPGDLIMAREAPVGNVAMIPHGLKPCLGQRTLLIRPNHSKVEPSFLNYFLNGPHVQGLIQAKTNGATVAHLNMKDVRTMPLPELPSLPVQRRIAGILSAYDELIENSQRRIKILESMARSLYREWFIQFRFPGHEHHPRVPSPLGDIPKGWGVGRLETICEKINSGGTPRTSANEYWGGGIPWLSSGETGNAFIIETDKTITDEGVSNSSTRFARSGCTVVASAGQGKTRGQTSMLCLDCYINQSTIALTADAKQISDNFLFFELSGRYGQLRQISDGSSRGSLTTRLLADLEVIVPSASLVHEFDALVAPIVKSIEIGLRRNKNLRRTRDLLLPRLLSGQIELEAS